MKTVLLPSLLLASFLIAGCQKDVHEVRRTEKDKYAVDGGGLSADTGHYSVSTGTYGPETGQYSSGGYRQGAPAAPSLAPAGIGGNPRAVGR